MNKETIEMLIVDLNYIRHNLPEYIGVIKEGAQDPVNERYFMSLIDEVAGLRSKIEQALQS